MRHEAPHQSLALFRDIPQLRRKDERIPRGLHPFVGHTSPLDDRFHETGLDEAGLHGTGIMFVDSSFEKS